ncbi:hypothetical protein Smp_144670 [Schistosoma mansoni]|uniref:hypothetical protein n=1 Tax=Schistosoma mansoni TaxID=6183 RepID=UPI0001A63909|nr:hypothetical protein Smp_144670 [Schistosoma mansoni]|eukprot:XP_018645737.1 hypothetical protein Smp_144670 [Schistosoma mansoni]
MHATNVPAIYNVTELIRVPMWTDKLDLCCRHKCPHQKRKTQITKPCEISEYTTQYIAHKLIPVESCKPPHKGVQAEGHMASDTTHR